MRQRYMLDYDHWWPGPHAGDHNHKFEMAEAGIYPEHSLSYALEKDVYFLIYLPIYYDHYDHNFMILSFDDPL